MQREQRLRRRRDFAAVYRRGRMQGNQLLVVRVIETGGEGAAERPSRFGFVAGKGVGGAVVRNRVKRRLREAARSLPVRPGLDIVIGARKTAAEADYARLRDALASLLKRSKALGEPAAPAAGQETT